MRVPPAWLDPKEAPDEFSPVVGGPLYATYARLGLLASPLERVVRRIATLVTIGWLPLLVLATAGGHAIAGVAVPFLADVAVQVQCLIVVPLMVSSELVIHRLRGVVRQFVERRIIRPADEPRFRAAVASAVRWRDSAGVEVALLVVALTVGHVVWRDRNALDVSTWYAAAPGGRALTAAGDWYVLVSLPIFRFLFLRWIYRVVVWHRFLWQVARMPLDLNPLHPDRAGGLGFVGYAVTASTPMLAAIMAMQSGQIADRLLHEGASLLAFKLEIIALGVIALGFVGASQVFFTIPLLTARRQGRIAYGTTASAYVAAFRARWLGGAAATDPSFLGSGDIQSLADLGNSYAVVVQMRAVPLGFKDLTFPILAMALPLVPVLLTILPLSEILKQLAKVVV